MPSLDDLLSAPPEAPAPEGLSWTPRQSPPLERGQGQVQLSRVRYTHDAMIDLIIAQPAITQNELAKHFDYSVSWVSIVLNSDAFQARLAQRKADLVDPYLVATIDEKLRAVASKSLDIVLEKLNNPALPFDDAITAVQTATKAMGMGQPRQGPTIQQSFVVAMPEKSEDARAWAAKYGARSPGLAAMMVGQPPEPTALENGSET